MARARENSVRMSLSLGSRTGKKPNGEVARFGGAGSAAIVLDGKGS